MKKGNMKKLADFLWALPRDRFSMATIARRRDSYLRWVDITGIYPGNSVERMGDPVMVGCALGWGPSAGVEPGFEGGWNSYAAQCFTEDYQDWCFGGGWVVTDNTPRGAAMRLYWVIEGNEPVAEYNYREWKKNYVPNREVWYE